MVKGSSLFCRAAYLAAESIRIFRALENESFLAGAGAWPREKFAERLAYYQGELIALHPFLELNGRITRMFFDLIAIANGYAPVNYGAALIDEKDGHNRYISASIACVKQADPRALQQLILEGLERVEGTT